MKILNLLCPVDMSLLIELLSVCFFKNWEEFLLIPF